MYVEATVIVAQSIDCSMPAQTTLQGGMGEKKNKAGRLVGRVPDVADKRKGWTKTIVVPC